MNYSVKTGSGRRRIIYVLLIVLSQQLYGQDYIINGDFEQRTICPPGFNLGWPIPDYVNYSPPWYTPTSATSDYLHRCNPNTTGEQGVGVPKNRYGFQEPTSGHGYMGIICYSSSSFLNYREFIQAPLSMPLTKDSCYELTLHINLADSSGFAIKNFGAYFSPDSLTAGIDSAYGVEAHIVWNDRFLDDQENWMTLNGNYTASGNEKFITLGNFANDKNTDTIEVSGSKLKMNGNFFSYYYIDDVTLLPQKTFAANLPEDTTICVGDPIVLNANIDSATYLWSSGDTTITAEINQPGKHWIWVDRNGCNVSDTIEILHNPFSIEIPDTMFCENDSVFISGGTTQASFQWSTGDTTDGIYIGNAGTYWLQANDGMCDAYDTMILTATPLPTTELGPDTALVCAQPLELHAGSNSTIRWSTGDTSESIYVSEQGSYWVEVSNGQCSITDTIFITLSEGTRSIMEQIPNVITPNGDGVNDWFDPAQQLNGELEIFNRWGAVLFNSDAQNSDAWNGQSVSGGDVPEGVYYWILKPDSTCPGENEFRGMVQVLR